MNPLPVAIVPPSLFSQVTFSGSVTPVILQVRVAADRETTSYPAIVTSENDSLLNKGWWCIGEQSWSCWLEPCSAALVPKVSIVDVQLRIPSVDAGRWYIRAIEQIYGMWLWRLINYLVIGYAHKCEVSGEKSVAKAISTVNRHWLK